MKRPRKEGLLRVIQLKSDSLRLTRLTGEYIRDFDASEWSHEWVTRGATGVLRVLHDNTEDDGETFDFVEFSHPVSIEFIAER